MNYVSREQKGIQSVLVEFGHDRGLPGKRVIDPVVLQNGTPGLRGPECHDQPLLDFGRKEPPIASAPTSESRVARSATSRFMGPLTIQSNGARNEAGTYRTRGFIANMSFVSANCWRATLGRRGHFPSLFSRAFGHRTNM
jgi:hypothetical protein